MTTTERPPAGGPTSTATTTTEGGRPRRGTRSADRPSAGERAYERRRRRERSMVDPRLTAVGRPIRASLGKVPVVLAAIVLLGGGIAGVLTINTVSDEIGLQVSRTNATIADLQLRKEALEQAVADADSTPRIAQEARKLGMGPADDPAIITIDGKGRSTLIGEPTPQAAQVPAAPPSAPTTAAPTSTPAPTTAAETSGAASTTAANAPQTRPTTAATTQAANTKPAQTKPAQTKPAQTKTTQTKARSAPSTTKPSSATAAGGNR